MKKRFWAMAVIYGLCSGVNAQAMILPEVSVSNITSKEKQVSVEVRISNLKSRDINFAIKDSGNKILKIVSVTSPVQDLWVLVDSSPLCRVNKIDQSVSSLVRALKSNLSAFSQVSVVGFTGTTSEVYLNNRLTKDIDDVQIDCDSKGLSASFEKPLSQMLKGRQSSLPLSVWVFTSGNLNVSDDTLLQLKTRKARLKIVLFNPILEKELVPAIDHFRSLLGNDKTSMVPLSTPEEASGFIPEKIFRVEFMAPAEGKLAFQIAVTSKKDLLGTTEGLVNVSQSGTGRVLERLCFWGLVLLGMVLIGVGLYRVIRYYRAIKCSHCGRFIRRSHGICLFCRTTQACLVGRVNYHEKRKVGKIDVIPLKKEVTTIGTCRRSDVPLFGQRKKTYAKLQREKTAAGRFSYRLIACEPGEGGSGSDETVRVNGNILTSHRYLGEGDKISIGSFALKFTVNHEKEFKS